MKAVILAGGLGERLRPLTNETPKPLLPICGKPIVEYCIENLRKHGIGEIILSIGYKADLIKNYFGKGDKLGVKIDYNVEDAPLGTGGAVKHIVKKFGIEEDFLLLWGDNLGDFNISRLLDEHGKNPGLITMILTPRDDVENFGAASLIENRIEKFVEKPRREEAPSNLINAGAFVLKPAALDVLPDGKSSIERQCFELLANEGKVFAYKHEGYWYPTDTLEKYNLAEDEIGKFLKLDESKKHLKLDLPKDVADILNGKSVFDAAIELVYKNWRGEISERKIIPLSVFYGESEFHRGEQWLMRVFDLDKKDFRVYSLRDVQEWVHVP